MLKKETIKDIPRHGQLGVAHFQRPMGQDREHKKDTYIYLYFNCHFCFTLL